MLQGHRQGKEDGDAIFPKYARPRGSDAASAMMMKRFRKVITDRKLTMHSLRHRMKDKLRNTGCPEAISMAILGHGSNTVASNYGSGYALEIMREHMERVWTYSVHTSAILRILKYLLLEFTWLTLKCRVWSLL